MGSLVAASPDLGAAVAASPVVDNLVVASPVAASPAPDDSPAAERGTATDAQIAAVSDSALDGEVGPVDTGARALIASDAHVFQLADVEVVIAVVFHGAVTGASAGPRTGAVNLEDAAAVRTFLLVDVAIVSPHGKHFDPVPFLALGAALQLPAAGGADAVLAAAGERFRDHLLLAATAPAHGAGATCVAASCSDSLLLSRCRQPGPALMAQAAGLHSGAHENPTQWNLP